MASVAVLDYVHELGQGDTCKKASGTQPRIFGGRQLQQGWFEAVPVPPQVAEVAEQYELGAVKGVADLVGRSGDTMERLGSMVPSRWPPWGRWHGARVLT